MKSTQQQSSIDIEIEDEEPDTLQKSIDEIEPAHFDHEQQPQNKKCKQIIITISVVLVSLFVVMLLGAVLSGRIISEELRETLRGKYLCQEVMVIGAWDDWEKDSGFERWNLVKIGEWVKKKYTVREINQFYSKSRHKCGFLKKDDFTLDLIGYFGLEVIAFQARPDTQIIKQLISKIKQQNLQRNIRITWQKLSGKSYTFLHFYRVINQQQFKFKRESVYIVELNSKLIQFYQKEEAKTIGDFSCGFCSYAANLRNAGFLVDGFDSNPRTPQISNSFAVRLDLTQIEDIGNRYDWVQCLQADQQIPAGKTQFYMHNLARHARKGIILSWSGSPNNHESQDEIIKIIQSNGFQYEQATTTEFRHRPYMLWFQYTLLVFKRNDYSKFKAPDRPTPTPTPSPSTDKTPQIDLTPPPRKETGFFSSRLENYLNETYFCKEFSYIQLKQQRGKNVLSIDSIKAFIARGHSPSQLEVIQENASRRCGLVKKQYVTTQFLQYRGLELIIFQSTSKEPLVDTLVRQVSQQQKDNLIKFIEEQIDGKSYIIIQFFKLLTPTKKGYFSGNDVKTVSEQHFFVQDLNKKLIEFYKNENAKSILDLGCGLCTYAMNLVKAGFKYVEGYDGNPYTMQLTNGFGSVFDLSQPRDLGKRFEWVQSFEVGEQIQEQNIRDYIENLARHAKQGIILSWAVVGQLGWYHINNKNNDEVIRLLARVGFQLDPTATTNFRSANNLMWFKNTVMIFRKAGSSKIQSIIPEKNNQQLVTPPKPEKLEPAPAPVPVPAPKPSPPQFHPTNLLRWNKENPTAFDTPLKNYLSSKYYCNNFIYIQQNQQPGKSVLLIEVLKGWAATYRVEEELDLLQETSSRKCGFIKTEDVPNTLDFLRFRGLQYVIFESEPNAPIINIIKMTISSIKTSISITELNIERLIKVITQQIDGRPYVIIQFQKYLKTNKKGYYNGNDDQNILNQHTYVDDLNTKLIEFYQREKVKSVVDFGCGLCTYAMNLRQTGFESEGYDGNPFTVQLTNGFASVLQLNEKQNLGKQFDWVQSFEVGQQLFSDNTMTYIENLVRHAKKGIIISWSVIGQQGWYQITNKNNDEVIQLLWPLGFRYDEQVTKQFRDMPNIMWFKQSLMVFRRATIKQAQSQEFEKIKSKAQLFHKQNQGKPITSLKNLSFDAGSLISKPSNMDYEGYGIQNKIQLTSLILDYPHLSTRINFSQIQKTLTDEIAYQVLQFEQNKDLQVTFPFIGWTEAQINNINQSKLRSFELAINLCDTPKTLEQFTYYNRKYVISQQKSQIPLCIFAYTSSLKQQNSHEKFLESVRKQNYTNYRVIYVDDFSPDKSAYQAHAYLTNSPSNLNNRIKFVRNLQHLGLIGSMFLRVKQYCGEKDIIVVANANDRFIGTQVFRLISSAYQNPQKWFVYSNYLNFFSATNRYTKGTGSSKLKTPTSQYRQTEAVWSTSHLLSFRRELFDKVPIQYFMEYQYEGKSGNAQAVFYTVEAQRFLVYSLLELAGEERVKYIDDYLYLYDVEKDTGCQNEQKYYHEYKARIQTPLKKLQNLSETPQRVENYKISQKILKNLKQKYQKYRNCNKDKAL